MKKILINIPHYKSLIKPKILKMLELNGFDLIVNKNEGIVDRNFIEKHIVEVVAIIAGNEKIDRQLLSKAKQLKIIARYGVGTDNIDLTAASEKNIFVTITGNSNTNAVAEHTICLMLSILKKITYYNSAVRSKEYEYIEPVELSGKTVGIIGYGRIGKTVAERLKGFDVKVLAYDPMVSIDRETQLNTEFVGLKYLIQKSDIVSLHIPDIPQNKGMLGKKEMTEMKSSAVIINTSRAKVINQQALTECLSNGCLAGAGLDVYNTEDESIDRLIELKNAIITPHIAGGTYESHENSGQICAQAIIDTMNNIVPKNVVNGL